MISGKFHDGGKFCLIVPFLRGASFLLRLINVTCPESKPSRRRICNFESPVVVLLVVKQAKLTQNG